MNIQILFLLVIAVAISSVSAIPINYDSNRALRHLFYAKQAYCNQSLIRNWTCEACPLHPNFRIYNVYNNETNDLQSFNGYDPTHNEIVIGWRGTWSAIGWIYDFDTTLVEFPEVTPGCTGCKMHQGYKRMYEYYRSMLWADVQKLMQTYPTATLAISGHSMGGGLGQISLLDFTVNLPQLKPIAYTFGTPRLGNPALVQWIASVVAPGNNVRVTHLHDPIPRTPAEWPLGYLHQPQEVWYNNSGNSNFSLCNLESYTAEDPNCIDSVSVFELNPEDHLLYLGRSTRCNLQDPAVEKKILTAELKQDPSYIYAQMVATKLRGNKRN